MYTHDELVNKILNGMSTDDIAKEMTDLLNGAVDEVNAIEKARAEEKAAAAKKEREHQDLLDSLAMNIIDAVDEYLKVAAPEVAAKTEGIITPQEIHDTVDSVVKLMDLAESWKALEDVFGTSFKSNKPVELTGSRLVDKNTTDYQKIMDEFFKSAGI